MMKHLVLFENYFNKINEEIIDLTSGATFYRDEGEINITVEKNKIIAVLKDVEGGREFTVTGNLEDLVSSLIFTDNLNSTYRTEGGFGTNLVDGTGTDVTGAPLVYVYRKKGKNVEVPYRGEERDFKKALNKMFFDMGINKDQGLKFPSQIIKTIYEVCKMEEARGSNIPESLKKFFAMLKNFEKNPSYNFITADAVDHVRKNEKLREQIKEFSSKI